MVFASWMDCAFSSSIMSCMFVFLMMLVLWQVCGPPGLMKLISGDKAKDKSQGEVYIYIYICICICLNLYLPSSNIDLYAGIL